LHKLNDRLAVAFMLAVFVLFDSGIDVKLESKCEALSSVCSKQAQIVQVHVTMPPSASIQEVPVSAEQSSQMGQRVCLLVVLPVLPAMQHGVT